MESTNIVPAQQQNKKFFTLEELSQYLSVPKSSLYTQICLKTFPPELVTRIGRRLRFDRERIDAWLEKQRGTPQN